MSATLTVACPNCQKPLKIPTALAGKTIRCKQCQGMFVVPGGAGPVAAKPAARPPAPPAPAAAPPPPDDGPIGFQDDDDDTSNPYTVVKDDLDVPRCPFCAKELDPPDTKICLNCGYDLIERKRHDTIHTEDHTPADWVLHLGPGVACVFVIILTLVLDYIFFTNMREWMTGSIFDSDEKNPVTGQKIFYVSPYCFNLWLFVISGFIIFLSGKFAYKRLVLNWKPTEKLIRGQED